MPEPTLYERYLELKKQGVHQRDAVARLGVSEGGLVAAFPETQYLGGDCMAFLPELEALGEVKSAVRNVAALSEKTGIYRNLELSPMMGTAINLGGLDLRLFMRHWKHIFAVRNGEARAFHFYDATGKAIQKVHLTEAAAIPAWERLCAAYRTDAAPVFETPPEAAPYENVELTDEALAAYREEWKGLKNVHHFRIVLSQFGIDRLQGLEYAPEGDAQKLKREAVEFIFRQCAERGMPLLVFVNNSGIVQIQTGQVHHVDRADGWLTVSDFAEEKFNFFLDDAKLAELWFVRRPGSNGIVHSIEAYDERRNLVLQLFGRPADAEAESEAWRALIAEVRQTYGL